MNKEQIVSWLTAVCGSKDWFHSVGFDRYDRVVVYVNYMNAEVLRAVPDWAEDGSQVLCHFAASAPDANNKFINKPQNPNRLAALVETTTRSILDKSHMVLAPVGPTDLVDTEEQDRELELSVRALTDELDRLERICGSSILSDIFFEEHDGDKAVTNLSSKYPEVRKRIHKLYQAYGFDVIYEELTL